jgi:uncharacterized membrane protein YdfJ with MMPL/SSD domain
MKFGFFRSTEPGSPDNETGHLVLDKKVRAAKEMQLAEKQKDYDYRVLFAREEPSTAEDRRIIAKLLEDITKLKQELGL